MKILYFSDEYTWNIYGTKRSTMEALQDHGHEVILVNKDKAGQAVELEKQHSPDQIWLFHSNLRLTPEVKAGLSCPVIGFGVSDPYYFDVSRFESYDAYVTYNKDTYEKVRDIIPCAYNRTACDVKFHRAVPPMAECDATMIGSALHARFDVESLRLDYVNELRKRTGKTILAFGKHWPDDHPDNAGFIDGDDFLPAVNSGKLGLDIQDYFSPLAHRMFEYAACGMPVITRRRDEVFESFDEDTEILAYEDIEELADKFTWYLDHPEKLTEIGRNAQERCLREHDIQHRIPGLVRGITEALGD